jgi:hypothetical protein
MSRLDTFDPPDREAVPFNPTSAETTVCQCGHAREQHGRLMIAFPEDRHIGNCGACGCRKFTLPTEPA